MVYVFLPEIMRLFHWLEAKETESISEMKLLRVALGEGKTTFNNVCMQDQVYNHIRR